jgi:hypothetical protein
MFQVSVFASCPPPNNRVGIIIRAPDSFAP